MRLVESEILSVVNVQSVRAAGQLAQSYLREIQDFPRTYDANPTEIVGTAANQCDRLD